MFLCIILIFVLQICYCSADCDCDDGVWLPIYAICIIGIIIPVLFFTTVALTVILYRLKHVKDSDEHLLFENTRRVSLSKYERQTSGDSRNNCIRDSMYDDTIQSKRNENACDNQEIDKDTDENEVKIETELKNSEPPNKIRRPHKVAVFPQMREEQMNELIKAVLAKNRSNEYTTSLTDLDKIVNDAKEEAKVNKIHDVSASTPELDIQEVPPSSIPKLPVYEANSKESKLRDEMNAMFNKNEFKTKFNQGKISSNKNETETDSKVNDEAIKSEENQDENNLKSDQGEINSKLSKNEDVVVSKSNQKELKPKVSQDDTDSKNNQFSGEITESLDKDVVKNDIYHFPPLPKPENEIYDILPSPKPQNQLYDYPPSPKADNELYDFPPSPKPSNELYDFPPSSKLINEIYECPPSSRVRNVIVSDSDATGYHFPISISDNALFDDPEYTNARTVPDKNLL